MGKIVRLEIDEALHATLTERAAINGRSVEEEVGAILSQAARPGRAALIEKLQREQDELARKYGVLSDSTPLMRNLKNC
ncbi:hypothetical protein GBZ26_06845 [Azospirillum formosense]|uniref:Antitoxin FitA-like ribbon-helix-helix domain-containing protein n=1 Tax=Azospirillum formosense TaxID=861533 RepID=A0ABX2KVP0_9PROT|nr:hypothetical protein [Azospirillum formosense]MBY3752584.1 hypothetical protein [Azospirillum formosense]NUB18929.1 hypothetical protein [Azospirillum formosense]